MNEQDHEIDDLLENFEFKPITDGLGFHHSLKEKKEIKTDLNLQSHALKNELETRVKQLKREADVNVEESSLHRGDLAPFYENEIKKEELPEINLESTEDQTFNMKASYPLRFFAWTLDLAILFISMAITFMAIIYFSDLPLDSIANFMITDELPTSFAFIFIMFYLFYFSVLDKTQYSTLGKNLLGLRVVPLASNKRVSLFQTLLRSIITLVSAPLIGLPLFLSFQDKISETEVVKK